MRAYFFGNLYLSSIQQGIQSAHCVAEMFTKYQYVNENVDNISQKCAHLYNWANDHKTMILLNGGYSENLQIICDLFNDEFNSYPWASFHEGVDALNGALTCVGIILPERVYGNVELISKLPQTTNASEYGALVQQVQAAGLTPFDMELAFEISKYGLAR